jgi:DNA-binding response OmpR family regulator
MNILLMKQAFRTLKLALEEQGHLVETVHSLEKADGKVRFADLIVLDLGRQGLIRLQKWRSSGVRAHVLALVSRDAWEDSVEALDCGADAVAVNPCSQIVILARIRALARRIQAEEGSPRVQIFDLEIDTVYRMVRRAGLTIKLTRSEYDLLHCLACKRGTVVTHAQIWAHLSGEDKESKSNTVTVYIRSLRKKIDKGFDLPLILTSWGKGYFLRGDS